MSQFVNSNLKNELYYPDQTSFYKPNPQIQGICSTQAHRLDVAPKCMPLNSVSNSQDNLRGVTNSELYGTSLRSKGGDGSFYYRNTDSNLLPLQHLTLNFAQQPSRFSTLFHQSIY
jgi:hypothetical protein